MTTPPADGRRLVQLSRRDATGYGARVLDVIGDALGAKLALDTRDTPLPDVAAALWRVADAAVLIADDLEAVATNGRE
ncbi:hypothetical protein [Georgenia daeguensis]|uniref:Uncharacterized protein n=1 Tax=Georgenia daeguensis TaxID=908355 RepID=A0ABP8EQH6_9MICO